MIKKQLWCIIVYFLKPPFVELRSIMVIYAPDNSPNAQGEWPCVWVVLSTFYRNLLWKVMVQWNLLMYTRCPKNHWNSFSEDRGWTLFSLFLQQPSHSQHYFPLWISIHTGEQPRQQKELFRAPKQTGLQNSLCRNQEQSALLLKQIPLLCLGIRNLEGWLGCALHSNSLLLSVRWIAKNPQHNSDELVALKQTPTATGSRYPHGP